MEAKIQKIFDDQFAVLNILKQNAMPAELEFYVNAELELREAYTQMSVPASAPTIESLRAKYKRTFEMISQLEFEKIAAISDEHWHRWVETQIKLFQDRLDLVTTQLKEMGSDVSDVSVTPMTQEKYDEVIAAEAHSTRLEESKMLLGLKLARLQRQGLSEEQISEKIDIQNLRSEIANLEQP
jgi:hypothetical protein